MSEPTILSLKRALETIEGESKFEEVELIELKADDFSEQASDLAWRILSHPRSTVTRVELRGKAKQLKETGAFTLVRRWCEEIPPKGSRSLALLMDRQEDGGHHAFEDLRIALQHSKNGVTDLFINDDHRNLRIEQSVFDEFLGPVLQSPHNQLKKLFLGGMQIGELNELTALALGLASPHCKVANFKAPQRIDILGLDAVVTLIEALSVMNSLVTLVIHALTQTLQSDDTATAMNHLVSLLARPGNKVQSLSMTWNNLKNQHIKILAVTLANEHCRIKELNLGAACSETESGEAIETLAMALRQPNNRLTVLNVTGMKCDGAGFKKLADSLDNPNCKLESLEIGKRLHDAGEEAIAVAKALETSTLNRLKELTLNEFQPPAVFRAFATSLRSRNNKLVNLTMQNLVFIDDHAVHIDLFRAVRVSNLVSVDVGIHPPFVRAFNEPFSQVLHTLMSIKHVPRLGQHASLRLLPVQDFILTIADTLGWPLDDLRL